jgi:hypothetical protein
MVHRSPYTGNVEPGVLYAGHGFWDDYHAWYPMMTLLYPERLGEILTGIGTMPARRADGFRSSRAPLIAAYDRQPDVQVPFGGTATGTDAMTKLDALEHAVVEQQHAAAVPKQHTFGGCG